jgi:hypothetical protein
MKLHSDVLDILSIRGAMEKAKGHGLVTHDIEFVEFQLQGSRSRKAGYEIQLGTYDQGSGPTKSRHYKNGGNMGATSGHYTTDRVWAATYDEWGWFIVELFNTDPEAIFGPYKGVRSFHAQTQNKYRPILAEWP